MRLPRSRAIAQTTAFKDERSAPSATKSFVGPRMFMESRLIFAAVFAIGTKGWREYHSEPSRACSSAVVIRNKIERRGRSAGGRVDKTRAISSIDATPVAVYRAAL